MTLLDIIRRSPTPAADASGSKIPWHDPDFSRRMLQEHLSQAHDAASRRADVIDRQVNWIHHELLDSSPARVLDICCGPGLYCQRLAALGSTCLGIDFGPASIEHAVEHTKGLPCSFRCEDVRTAEFGSGFDLALLIHGEFNAFAEAETDAILTRAFLALKPDGVLLLEVNAPQTIESETRRTWSSAESGLFTERPHLCIEETIRDADTRTETTRWYIVDAATGDVTPYSQVIRLCSREQYERQIMRAGFRSVEVLPSLGGSLEGHYVTVVARK